MGNFKIGDLIIITDKISEAYQSIAQIKNDEVFEMTKEPEISTMTPERLFMKGCFDISKKRDTEVLLYSDEVRKATGKEIINAIKEKDG